MNNVQSLKQPKVFGLACITAMFERGGFYTLSFLFVLYAKDHFNWSDTHAFALFALLNAFAYLTPTIGGYLADNVFGIRRAIILGLVLEASSLSLLAIPNDKLFFPALALMILGVGFYKTSPTNLLGRSYEEQDPRIDSGFTLYYMTMNIGVIAATIAMGLLRHYVGWHMAFFFGAIMMYASILSYFILRRAAYSCDSEVGREKLNVKAALLLLIGLAAACIFFIFLLAHTSAANYLFIILTIAACCYFIFEITRSSKEERPKIIACLCLIIIGMIFYILYFQLYTSITLFIQRCVHRSFFGFKIPVTYFLGLDCFWIVVLSPVLAMGYNFLSKRGKDLLVTTKFQLGLVITALCFFVLKLGTLFASGCHSHVSPLWIVFAIFLYALGELFVGALGVAMITRIAPKRMYGMMMGAWFFIAWGLGSSISGRIARLASIPHGMHGAQLILAKYGVAFSEMGWIGIISAIVIALLIVPYIKRTVDLK